LAERKLLKDTNPELLNEWDFDKNIGVDPKELLRSYSNEVWWKCSKDERHVWKAAVRRRVYNKTGCLYCAGKLVLREESFGAKHPDLMEEWDWDKNGDLDPYNLSCNSNKSIYWVCKNDPSHTWKVDLYHRTRKKTGCRKCSDKNRPKRQKKKLLVDAYPHIAKEWYYENNSEIDISKVTHGSSLRVWWKCSADPSHTWQSTVANRTSKHISCPKCSGEAASKINSLSSIFPEVAEEWHYDKNAPLLPENVTRASGQKVWWLCKNDPDHEWQAIVRNRTILGSKCPVCENEIKLIRLRGYMLDGSGGLTEQYKIFAKNLFSIEAIVNEAQFSKDSYDKAFLRMTFSAVITSMETYLSDLFFEKVVGNDEYIDLLLKNATEFQNRKFSVDEAIYFHEKKKSEAKKYIKDIIWHNLSKVSHLYRKVLSIQFDSSLTPDINKLIGVRHDVVHRNGRKKNGGLRTIDVGKIKGCISSVKEFIEKIEVDARNI